MIATRRAPSQIANKPKLERGNSEMEISRVMKNCFALSFRAERGIYAVDFKAVRDASLRSA